MGRRRSKEEIEAEKQEKLLKKQQKQSAKEATQAILAERAREKAEKLLIKQEQMMLKIVEKEKKAQEKLALKAEKELLKSKKSKESSKIKDWISLVIFNKINWAAEMPIFYKLSDQYSKDFLLSLHKKVPSLAWFLTENGKSYLLIEKAKWDYIPTEYNVDYQEDSVIELPKITKKITPKNFYGKD